MTNLTKTVRRKVQTARGEALVVALAPEGIWLREPRKRIAYLLPYGVAFIRAADLYAQAERRRKVAERKARRTAQ
jgi:hypothetical protein